MMRYVKRLMVAVLAFVLLFLNEDISHLQTVIARLSLEYLPTTCYGKTSEQQISQFLRDLNDTHRNKRILLWNYMWGSRSWNQPLGQETFLDCPEQRCELTTDRCLQPVSDALLLYWPKLYINTPNGLPSSHPTWQKWVLGVYESEAYYEHPQLGSTTDLDGKINWIFSHRFDADIFMPYNYFLQILEKPTRLRPVIPRNISSLSLPLKAEKLIKEYDPTTGSDYFTLPSTKTDYAKNKTKLALWFVSNCHSKGAETRIKLFKELRKYIDIDVFSKPHNCEDIGGTADPCKHDSSCSKQLMSSYKFYLSFENSECNYYITEKFFNPLTMGTVPIAFGAPLKHYEAFAPKDSFLHLNNFSSIEDLAKYMKFLDENDKQYNRYLEWKKSYVQLKNYDIETSFYCKVCSDLWDTRKKNKVYDKFSDWWNKDKNCKHEQHELKTTKPG